MTKHDFEYDFVISYAGEDTAIAEQLSAKLEGKDTKVFFAPDKLEQTWGANLTEFLADVYSKKALFCIPLISKDYVRKQWTRHEWRSAQARALKEIDTAYILPIRLDATELPGLLETTGYLSIEDIRLDEIVDLAIKKLHLHIENVEVESLRQPLPDKVWEYVPQPNQRSAFLRENNYLSRKSSDFGKNAWTKHLYSYDYETQSEKQAQNFFSISATTYPSSQFFDISKIQDNFDLPNNHVIRSQTPADSEWQIFNLSKFHYTHTGTSNIVRYYHPRPTGSEVQTHFYIRFEDDGTVEYCNVDPFRQVAIDEKLSGVFDFIDIMGSVWKFINMMSEFYKRNNYFGKGQISINLVNTSNTFLCGFAESRANVSTWASPCGNAYTSQRFRYGQNHGMTIEPNIQLVYVINFGNTSKLVEEYENLLRDVSHRLQRSFNVGQLEDRHLSKDKKQFPWKQFGRNNDI